MTNEQPPGQEPEYIITESELKMIPYEFWVQISKIRSRPYSPAPESVPADFIEIWNKYMTEHNEKIRHSVLEGVLKNIDLFAERDRTDDEHGITIYFDSTIELIKFLRAGKEQPQ